MKRKFVPENIEELNEWYSTDSGAYIYADQPEYEQEEELSNLSGDDLEDLVPPNTFKFDPNSFDLFISELIKAIPENPEAIVQVFTRTLEKHPYLTRKPIGFASNNPFNPSIMKFKEALENI